MKKWCWDRHKLVRARSRRSYLEYEGRGDLVGCIADKDIERRQIHFYHIAEQNFQFLLLRCSLDTFGDLGAMVHKVSQRHTDKVEQLGRKKGSGLTNFGGHTGVELYSYNLPYFLEDSDCQVSRAGADFEDSVGGLQVGFLHRMAVSDKGAKIR